MAGRGGRGLLPAVGEGPQGGREEEQPLLPPAPPPAAPFVSVRARTKVLHNVRVLRVASLRLSSSPECPPSASECASSRSSPISTFRELLRSSLATAGPFRFPDWALGQRGRDALLSDFQAGFTVGVMLVPQAMAYARIAGLDVQHGLYAASWPLVAYAFLGSSRQAAVGPVALTAFLLGEAIKASMPEEWSEEERSVQFPRIAALLAFMVGCIMAAAGVLRLGWLVRFLSQTVLSGFTSAAALSITMSQLKYWFRSKAPQPMWKGSLDAYFAEVLSYCRGLSLPTFLLGSASFAALFLLRRVSQQHKRLHRLAALGPLAVVTLATASVWLTRAQVETVGVLPRGLPSFKVDWCVELLPRLWLPALEIAGVACLESISVGKALAARFNYELDANQELVGLGAANLVASTFGAFPVAGSFSRSTVNAEAGAQSQLAGLLSAAMVLSALAVLTPLFSQIPMAALGAIVMVMVAGLMDFREALFLRRVDAKDFALWAVAFAGTLLLGVEAGVLGAVAASLAFVVHETANPRHALLGRLEGTRDFYCSTWQYPEARPVPGIAIIRLDAPVYFANVNFIKDALRKYTLGCRAAGKEGSSSPADPVRYVVFDMTGVSYIDPPGCHGLAKIFCEYKEHGIQMAISNPNSRVQRTLHLAGTWELLTPQWIFLRIHDAVLVCQAHMAAGHHRATDAHAESENDVESSFHSTLSPIHSSSVLAAVGHNGVKVSTLGDSEHKAFAETGSTAHTEVSPDESVDVVASLNVRKQSRSNTRRVSFSDAEANRDKEAKGETSGMATGIDAATGEGARGHAASIKRFERSTSAPSPRSISALRSSAGPLWSGVCWLEE